MTGDRALVGLKLPEESSAGAPGDKRPGLGRTVGPAPLLPRAAGATHGRGQAGPQHWEGPLPAGGQGPPAPPSAAPEHAVNTVPEQTLAWRAWGPLCCPTPTSRPSHTLLLPCHPARPVSGPPPVTRAPPLGCSRPRGPPCRPHPRCFSERLCWTPAQALGLTAVPGCPRPQALTPLYPVLHASLPSPSGVEAAQGPGQVWHSSHIPSVGWESGGPLQTPLDNRHHEGTAVGGGLPAPTESLPGPDVEPPSWRPWGLGLSETQADGCPACSSSLAPGPRHWPGLAPGAPTFNHAA